MFAVPGWAISADALKTQTKTATLPTAEVQQQTQPPPSNEAGSKKPRKRKRGGQDKKENVTVDNFADLWSKHIEQSEVNDSEPPQGNIEKLSKKEKKRLKQSQDHDDAPLTTSSKALPSDAPSKALVNGKERYDKQKEKQKSRAKDMKDEKDAIAQRDEHEDGKSISQPTINSKVSQGTTDVPTEKSLPVPVQPANTKLTPLQSSMRQKLISSRFRYLNETLYTTPSVSSFDLFKQNPTFFSEYHEGFRRQVTAWPENPVEGFLAWIKLRGRARGKDLGSQKAKFHKEGKGKKSKAKKSEDAEEDVSLEGIEPLPRNPRSGTCTIADLGCGDGQLAQKLTATPPNPSSAKALKLHIHSYDLASASPLVTVADIRSLPLEDGSVDVAIFSLALMGTNWIDFIEEAYRILRWKGECWISEVGSRFGGLSNQRRVAHSVGNRSKDKEVNKGKKKGKKGGDDDNEGAEDFDTIDEENAVPQSSTDVSAFVSVLKRRGFLLQDQPDLGNKMFVRMRFVKAAPPVVGKCVRAVASTSSRSKRFLEQEQESEISVEDEARVLKPCVYKIR